MLSGVWKGSLSTRSQLLMAGLLSLSDACLVRRALSRDREALELLVVRYLPRAHSVAAANGIEAEAREDVVQESFLKALRALSSLRKQASFGPWFLTIVRNTARRRYRVRSAMPLTETIQDDRPEPHESIAASELSEALRSAVEDLPVELREPVFLHYYGGESLREIARALGVTGNAVKKRLQRARARLSAALWRDLGETLESRAPSRKSWARGGRQLALALSASTLWSTAHATAAGGSVTVPATSLTAWSVFMSMKTFLAATAAAVVILSGLFLMMWRETPPDAPDTSLRATFASGDSDADDEQEFREPVALSPREAPAPIPRADVDPPPTEAPPKAPYDGPLVLQGRVLSPAGNTVSGARVWWLPSHTDKLPEAHAHTDASGRFQFEVEAADEYHQLVAYHEGWAPTWRGGVVPGTTEEPGLVELTLGEPHWLRVRTLDPEGAPIQHTEVEVSISGSHTTAPRWLEKHYGEKKTDEAGRCEFNELPAGPVSLTLGGPHRPKEPAPTGAKTAEDETETAEEAIARVGRRAKFAWKWQRLNVIEVDQEVDVQRIRQDAVIAGSVVDAESGLGIDRFTIKVDGISGTHTFRQGRFELDDFPPDKEVTLIVQTPGYGRLEYKTKTPGVAGRSEVSIQLAPAQEKTLVVVDSETGTPIPGAQVILDTADDWYSWSNYRRHLAGRSRLYEHSGTTDSQGTFRFQEGVKPWTVVLVAKGYGARVVLPEDRPELSSGELVCLPLDPEAALEIHASDALLAQGPLKARLRTSDSRIEIYRSPSVTADAPGIVDELQSGAYRLTLHGNKISWSMDVTVASGEHVEIYVGAEAGPSILSGMVTASTEDETAIPYARVTLVPKFECDFVERTAQSDVNGQYTFQGLNDGTYRIWAQKPERGSRLSGFRPIKYRDVVVKGDTVFDVPGT